MKMFELVSWFQLEYSGIVKDMRECSHHGESLNPYHLEGTIWEHTLLVCKQAENASYEVQVAALLHDIGKPATRSVNPKNGRVSFYNHDAVSAFMSLEITKKLGMSRESRIRVFNMIALHTQIYKLSAEQLAATGNIQLVSDLIDLGNADHDGRFHSHEGATILGLDDIIEAKGRESMKHVGAKDKTVTILCGLPSVGKSSWVVNNRPEYVISRDSLLESNSIGSDYKEKWNNADHKNIDRLLNFKFNKAKDYSNVAVDMTHMSKKSRRKSLSHFNSDYHKKCIIFLLDLPTVFDRNSKRKGKNIDRVVIDKMMRSFYLPTFSEFDEIEYVL